MTFDQQHQATALVLATLTPKTMFIFYQIKTVEVLVTALALVIRLKTTTPRHMHRYGLIYLHRCLSQLVHVVLLIQLYFSYSLGCVAQMYVVRLICVVFAVEIPCKFNSSLVGVLCERKLWMLSEVNSFHPPPCAHTCMFAHVPMTLTNSQRHGSCKMRLSSLSLLYQSTSW